MQYLKAPFPWFGGKSRVAPIVWKAFGNVPNYVEPFAGSLAVLLGRPHAPNIETVNDIDCYLANFWRAVQAEPEQVAKWASNPVNEADLHARHKWLVEQADFRERMLTDPHYYDVKIAGWWVWGQCAWLGRGWCAEGKRYRQLPKLGGGPGATGNGVNRLGVDVQQWMGVLANRLSKVRVACGDWSRVVTGSVTWRVGLTGVFLDPPYGEDTKRANGLYVHDSTDVASNVREWAIANGDNPLLRIALCGYEGEHEMPETWRKYEWHAQGGYSNQSERNHNKTRERIWFSPHCLPIDGGANVLDLLDAMDS